MEKNKQSLCEKAVSQLMELAREYKTPLWASWIVGLLAHMYVFTNKFVNYDELLYLFSKGFTFEAGRWMLALTSLIFPDVSMPWIYGIICLALISVTVCFVVRIFEIQNRLLQGLLAGLIVSFPAQDSIFCFMFTSAPYALALFLSVLSVYIYACTSSKKRYFISSAVLVCALGIYQSYIALAAGLYIVLMICALINGSDAKETFRTGVVYLSLLVASIAVYYAITLGVCKLTGTELLVYRYSENSIFFRILLAYNGFVRTLVSGYFGYVNGLASLIAHFICLLTTLWLLIKLAIGQKNLLRSALTAVCLGLLPLAVYSLYLVAQTGIINSWTQYPFVCVYILAVVIFDRLCVNVKLRDVVAVAMTVVLVSNVYFANKVYLKLSMDYENAYAFYTVLASDIRKSQDYRKGMEVYISGTTEDGIQPAEEYGLGLFNGPADDLVNVFSKDMFMKYYIGCDFPMVSFYDYQTRAYIEKIEAYASMPAYPEEGSIAELDGYLVVKLG